MVQSRAQHVMVPRPGGPRVAGVVLEGGTLTSSAGTVGSAASTALRMEGGERGGAEGRVVGTLLGPEGADPPWMRAPVASVSGWGLLSRSGAVRVLVPLVRLSPAGGGRVGFGGVGSDGGRLVVENCTVDASIFL